MNGDNFIGTVHPNEDYNPERAAARLKKAMKGIGSDEKSIISVLTSHDSIQRAEISTQYKTMYGRDLVEDLRSEIGGHFEDTVVALLTSPYDLLVTALDESLSLFGNDADALTEILCCRTPDQIDTLSTWYEKKFSRNLEEAVASSLSGDFKNLMVGLLAAGRQEGDAMNIEMARADAQALYDNGIGKNFDTDEEEFTRILNTRSFAQLRETFLEYDKLASESFEDSIKSECSGDYRKGLLAIVSRIKDPSGFFAERLRQSMNGAGSNDQTLIRIIVSRSEIDLENVKVRYNEKYGVTLAEDIKSDTGGDYAKILLSLLN